MYIIFMCTEKNTFSNYSKHFEKESVHAAQTDLVLIFSVILGNTLRMQLLQDHRVLFAGYKIPHPLLHELVIKVRTNGAASPTQCLIDAVDVLNANIKDLTESFKAQTQEYKIKHKHSMK